METIKLNKGTQLTIVGDIHEHKDQFLKLLELVKPSPTNILVSVGDIFDRGEGNEAAKEILIKLIKLNEANSCFMVRGNHEQKRKNWKEDFSDEEKWAINRPLSLRFTFENQSNVLVLHGGILPSHSWKDLDNNTDVVYIRNIDVQGKKVPLIKVKEEGHWVFKPKREGKPWHEYYDGRFGYIVAGHEPQKDGLVKFYNYSCNVDTACFHTGILSAVVINECGVKETVQVKGKACRPD